MTKQGMKIVLDVQQVADKLGHPPSVREYSKRGKFSRNQITKEFGTYLSLISAAGLKTKSKNHREQESVNASIRALWASYRKKCKYRNKFWGLTVEELAEITSKPCAYCETPPHQKFKSYLYNGIDRVDNSQGYVRENCVPCCGECNFLKGTRLSFEEMRTVGRALKRHRSRA